MTTRSLEDIYQYEQDALKVLKESNKIFFHQHPHYDEIRQLLTEQIEDELWEHAHTRPN